MFFNDSLHFDIFVFVIIHKFELCKFLFNDSFTFFQFFRLNSNWILLGFDTTQLDSEWILGTFWMASGWILDGVWMVSMWIQCGFVDSMWILNGFWPSKKTARAFMVGPNRKLCAFVWCEL